MLTILTIVLVLIAIAMIAIILLQRGAGATAGASFGSGASGTVFGARGAASFLTRTTGVLAAMFFAIALAMAVMVSRGIGLPDAGDSSVIDPGDARSQPLAPGVRPATSNGQDGVIAPTISVDDLPAAETTAGDADEAALPSTDAAGATDRPQADDDGDGSI